MPLPWDPALAPLMLAPMQGLTNRALRGVCGDAEALPDARQHQREIAAHLARLLCAYTDIFCGEAQILAKLREALVYFDDPDLRRWARKLEQTKAALQRC